LCRKILRAEIFATSRGIDKSINKSIKAIELLPDKIEYPHQADHFRITNSILTSRRQICATLKEAKNLELKQKQKLLREKTA
jgi:hypothetical protein